MVPGRARGYGSLAAAARAGARTRARPAQTGAGRLGGWSYTVRDGVGLFRVDAWARAGVTAVVSSRCGGVSRPPWDSLNLGRTVGDAPEAVDENRRRFAGALGLAWDEWDELATASQVHGVTVHRVRRPGPQGVAADALIAAGSGVALAILVADCAPLFLYDPLHGAIALCHAGWRGTAGNIAGAAVAALGASYGSRPGDLLAAVGPAIGPCCYEVDEPVLARLRAAAPWADAVTRPGRAGHAWLDLPGANARFLAAAGLDPARIAVSGICTACTRGRLYSHRAGGGRSGRMAAVLTLPR